MNPLLVRMRELDQAGTAYEVEVTFDGSWFLRGAPHFYSDASGLVFSDALWVSDSHNATIPVSGVVYVNLARAMFARVVELA